MCDACPWGYASGAVMLQTFYYSLAECWCKVEDTTYYGYTHLWGNQTVSGMIICDSMSFVPSISN